MSNPTKKYGPGYMRKFNLRQNYGMSLEEYDALYQKQKGCCAICLLPEDKAPKKRLFVDHCHQSGKIRGLLCGKCNTGLGMLGDNIGLIQIAMLYLKGTHATDQ
jgi:hypothetical protein